MLRNIFQRSLTRPIVAKSVVKTTLPASTRLFSVNLKQQEEAKTLKPTSGKIIITKLNVYLKYLKKNDVS